MAITKKSDGSEIAIFEDQNGTHQAYWNGKKYGGNTLYVTVDGRTKVSISDRDGIRWPSHTSLEFAKAALKALEII